MKEIIYFQFLTKYIWIHNRKKKKNPSGDEIGLAEKRFKS